MLTRREFSPFMELLLEWFYDVLPPFSPQVFSGRRALHLLDPSADVFLSVWRFKFAWAHTSRQMFDKDWKILLQFVMAKLASMPEETREECVYHLESDVQLRSRFRPIGSYWPGSMDYEADVVGFQMCCLLFQRFYDGYRRAGLYERDRGTLNTYLQVLLSGVTTSSITSHSAQSTLRVRFSLFYVRWYLLVALVEDGHDGPTIRSDALQILLYVFSDGSAQSGAIQMADGEQAFRSYHEAIDRPWTLLYVLNSWQVNSMDASGHQPYGDLEENMRSCLVPLHDDMCCRQSDTMRHAAVCNALTMIAHLLRATEGDRMELLRSQDEYDCLLNHGDSPFVEWLRHFEIGVDERQRAPSSEFIDVLQGARLHGWLEMGNDFSSSPAFGTSVGRLLHHRVSPRDVTDNATSPPSRISTVVDVLRALARRVNFGALPLVDSQEPPQDPDSGAGATAVSDSGLHTATESASSSSPMAEPFAEFPMPQSSAVSQASAISTTSTPGNTRAPSLMQGHSPPLQPSAVQFSASSIVDPIGAASSSGFESLSHQERSASIVTPLSHSGNNSSTAPPAIYPSPVQASAAFIEPAPMPSSALARPMEQFDTTSSRASVVISSAPQESSDPDVLNTGISHGRHSGEVNVESISAHDEPSVPLVPYSLSERTVSLSPVEQNNVTVADLGTEAEEPSPAKCYLGLGKVEWLNTLSARAKPGEEIDRNQWNTNVIHWITQMQTSSPKYMAAGISSLGIVLRSDDEHVAICCADTDWAAIMLSTQYAQKIMEMIKKSAMKTRATPQPKTTLEVLELPPNIHPRDWHLYNKVYRDSERKHHQNLLRQ
ncbi:hypothetical protein PENSPDRAFT_668427 [Peniophora sp. CONT]|nr:hypothetical protein PENSPDRAFT_668427 [Peniophora sp. CONT]